MTAMQKAPRPSLGMRTVATRSFLWQTALLLVCNLVTAPGLRAQEEAPAAHQEPPQDTRQDVGKDMILLTVDKSALRADLRTLPEMTLDSRLLHSFRIAIGKQEGDKQREGDNRTPEGIYFSQKHIVTTNLLPAKYGPYSIPLNFPNVIDHRDGKTGYGIWLHGAGNDDRIASAQVTEGCVAFYNADIVKLKSWLPPDQGIVVIAKDVSEVNRPEDINAIHTRTLAWIAAWSGRRIDDYISYYHPQFDGNGKSRAAYHQYKKRVFASYAEMTLKMNNLRVVSHPKYAISIMNQDFAGDRRFRSQGRKILYWQKSEDGWQIVRETFDQKHFEPLTFNTADIASLRAPAHQDSTQMH